MAHPDRLRLPLAFDPELLATDLRRAAAGGWYRHAVRQNYEGDWEVIALRASKDARHPIAMISAHFMSNVFVDTPLLGECPYFREVLAQFKCTLRSARLMRLTPGSTIREHSDPDLAFEDGIARLHIAVLTNPDVDFRLNGTRVPMEAGSTWYVRLSEPHTVANRGTTDRVHMVVDAEVNDWLKDLFDAAAAKS
jgi:hypothetical protein